MVIGLIATFLLIWLWGYKDVMVSEVNNLDHNPTNTIFSLTDDKIVSPVSGKVLSVFLAKRAIGLESDYGNEILVHIGLDTVNLDCEGFEVNVKTVDFLYVGDSLVECDIDKIEATEYNPITMVIVTNTTDYQAFDFLKSKTEVTAGEVILTIAKKVSEENRNEINEPVLS